jgi:DNA-formamidopyrimidine glycosylase
MPELAECKVFTDQLQKYKGLNLTSIEPLATGKFIKQNLQQDIDKLCFPLKNAQFNCKGKFLYWVFEEDNYLLITLGMTGSFSETPNHAAIKFIFEDKILYFNDIRHFGTFKITNNLLDLLDKLSTLGWDPIKESDRFTDQNKLNSLVNETLVKLIKSKNKTIAEAMLDQSIFCGAGNYIRAQVLYDSKINPTKMASSITEEEVKLILKYYYDIGHAAYKHNGATLATYKDMNGREGSFASHLTVYGRKTDPLGNKVIKTKDKQGRAIHWVPEVQI